MRASRDFPCSTIGSKLVDNWRGMSERSFGSHVSSSTNCQMFTSIFLSRTDLFENPARIHTDAHGIWPRNHVTGKVMFECALRLLSTPSSQELFPMLFSVFML